jgi:hypothetical protein
MEEPTNEWMYKTPPKSKEGRKCPDAPKKKKRVRTVIPFILDCKEDKSSPCKEKF